MMEQDSKYKSGYNTMNSKKYYEDDGAEEDNYYNSIKPKNSEIGTKFKTDNRGSDIEVIDESNVNNNMSNKEESILSKKDNIANTLKSQNAYINKYLNPANELSTKQKIEELDTRTMKEPIIIKDNFIRALKFDIKSQRKIKNINTDLRFQNEYQLIDLKLLDYDVLSQIMSNCGYFPEKTRFHFWKFLLSLPHNQTNYEKLALYGVHPFYKDIDQLCHIKDAHLSRKVQQICSHISYWNAHVGNVFFLPNIVFPFLKAGIKGDDVFLTEIVISFLTTWCQYWFEFYPGAPLNHLKLSEKIIFKECPSLYKHFKNFDRERNTIDKEKETNVKLADVFWNLMKNVYSDIFDKDTWLQFIDFLFTHNHRPELLLYFNSAYLLSIERLIYKCKTKKEIDQMFNTIHKPKLMGIFNKTLELYKKYNPYQLYKYKPHVPFNLLNEEDNYPIIDKFPLDFLETTAKIKEDLFRKENEFEKKKAEINDLDGKFKELLRKEDRIQKTYESIANAERTKAKQLTQELDLIIFQKNRINDTIKNKKLEKVDLVNRLVEKSLNSYNQIKNAELERFEEELRRKRVLEEMDLKARMQNEELNNLEFEANRKLFQLMNLRCKDETDRKQKVEQDIREKERNLNTRLLEEKWELEDEEKKQRLENLRNLKEYEILKQNEETTKLEKHNKDKLTDYEQQLYIQQVERERKLRHAALDLDINKDIVEKQLEKKTELIRKDEENHFKKLVNEEYDVTKTRKLEHYDLLIKNAQQNIMLVEQEEKALLDYERTLSKKQMSERVKELYKKGELKAMEDEKAFQDQIMSQDQENRTRQLKLAELEKKKKDIAKDLKNLQEMKLTESQGQIGDQKNNFDKYRNMYNDETVKQISQKYKGNNESVNESYEAYQTANSKLQTTNNKSSNPNVYSSNEYGDKTKLLERENQIRNENKKYYDSLISGRQNNDNAVSSQANSSRQQNTSAQHQYKQQQQEPEVLSSYNKSSVYDVSKSNVLSSYEKDNKNNTSKNDLYTFSGNDESKKYNNNYNYSTNNLQNSNDSYDPGNHSSNKYNYGNNTYEDNEMSNNSINMSNSRGGGNNYNQKRY